MTTRPTNLVTWLILLYAVFLAYKVAAIPEFHQWDFPTYYQTGQAWLAGLNPYDQAARESVAQGAKVEFQFVYTPLSIPLFGALGLMDFLPAFNLFLAIKCLLIAFLAWLWRRIFVPEGPLWGYALVLLLGFNGTIFLDVMAGNVSLIEQAFLWTGFVFWLRERPGWFTVCVLVASIFKMVPILFLGLHLLSFHPRRWRHLFLGAAAFLVLHGLSALWDPGLFMQWVRIAVARFDEGGGSINPAGWDLARDLVTRGGIWLGLEAHRLLIAALALYACLADGVLWATLWGARRLWLLGGGDWRRAVVFLACLSYVLIAPRCKDYSYIMVLAPAWFVLLHARWPSRLGLLLLALVLFNDRYLMPPLYGLNELFMGYHPWLLAALLWVMLLREIARGPSWTQEGRRPGWLEA